MKTSLAMNPRKLTGLALLLTIAGLAAQSEAQVSFDFNYVDVGVGFNDATNGAARRAALESSAQIVESLFSNYSATINIDVNGGETNNSFLASASTNYTAGYPGIGFGDRGDVMTKILNGNGADPSAGTADGFVNWNFQDFQWEFGNDFQAGEFDFVSTVVHELMHTIGFASGIQQNGNDLWGNTANTPGTWSPFDEFVADNSGALINDTTFINDKARWDVASIGGSGTEGLFFVGAEAMAANGGNAVNLFSPGTWANGSSGSHIDDAQYGGFFVMESAAAPGLGVRNLHAVERAMLRDIGYSNLTAVPEPSGLVLLGGLGMLALFRRKRVR